MYLSLLYYILYLRYYSHNYVLLLEYIIETWFAFFHSFKRGSLTVNLSLTNSPNPFS